MTFVPSGTNGILLKSWLLNKYTHDDSIGFTLEFFNRFNVNSS